MAEMAEMEEIQGESKELTQELKKRFKKERESTGIRW